MSRRILVIPAAGLGSRLGAAIPKLLVPVAGVPMIDWLERLYRGFVSEVVLIVHPSFEARVRQHVASWPLSASCVVQDEPTGMLDAIMLAGPEVRSVSPASVWITWCDQVAVHPSTIAHLADAEAAHPGAALVMPTVQRRSPYVHLQRGSGGRILQVLHRREGDRMPDVGESDMGVFALSAAAYLELLPLYEKEVGIGQFTRERNFLPFIPWLAARREVVTFPAVDEIEAVGVNTPEELTLVERYLAGRDGSPA
jgi:bifunctional UDP-N-acetylglucosamine pyrophosphorylase / glucosamine-1-phosphate N-acetyltransferase